MRRDRRRRIREINSRAGAQSAMDLEREPHRQLPDDQLSEPVFPHPAPPVRPIDTRRTGVLHHPIPASHIGNPKPKTGNCDFRYCPTVKVLVASTVPVESFTSTFHSPVHSAGIVLRLYVRQGEPPMFSVITSLCGPCVHVCVSF